MIRFGKIGEKGRLGNQLFQIASTIGIANKNNTQYSFNKKDILGFDFVLPTSNGCPRYLDEYPNMGFREEFFNIGENIEIDGYFQSEKYFCHVKKQIIDLFKFNSAMSKDITRKYQLALRLDPTTLHVRRGDYAHNGWWLGDSWYLDRMKELNGLVLVFSDDLHYCEALFKDFPNVLYIYEDPIESLCLMSKCRHHVISNSTFSWWGAYLSQSDDVTYPNWFHEINNGNCTFPNKDFYPQRWKMK